MNTSATTTPTNIILREIAKAKGNLNVNTARAYNRLICDFAEFLDSKEIYTFQGLTNDTVSSFLKRYNMRPTAYNQALSAILFILERCIDADIEIENFERIKTRVKQKKPPKANKLFLSRYKLLQARDNACVLFEKRNILTRNLLIFDLAMHTMMRCDELAQIKLGDIDVAKKRINVRGKGGAGDDQGNRVVTDSIRLTDELTEQVIYYVDQWRIQCNFEQHKPMYCAHGSMLPASPLFTSQKGNGLSSSAINQIASKIIGSLYSDDSVPGNHAIHCIRRSMATARLNNGIDITMIQRLLRHASIQTTLRYLNMDQKEIDQAYLKPIESSPPD